MAEAELRNIRANNRQMINYRTALPTRFEAGGSVALHPNYTANVLVSYLTRYKRADLNLINDFRYGDFHLILNEVYKSYENLLLGLKFMIHSSGDDLDRKIDL